MASKKALSKESEYVSEKRKYKEYMLENKDEFLEKYKKIQPKSKKMKVLTKSQKKELGIGKDQGKAVLKYARVPSRKAKVVMDLVRGKDVEEATAILKNMRRGASEFLLKLLKSAVANAVNKPDVQLDENNLYISEIYADQGPTLKRIRPRAQGRANRIRKRTSHLTLIVKEKKS
jgi:large subunit ribosomal protein L22